MRKKFDIEIHPNVIDFIAEQPEAAQNKIRRIIAKVLSNENRDPARFKKLTGSNGIWEFRIKNFNIQYRILAFFDKDKIVITNGFIKKVDKTPQVEIEKAKTAMKNYYVTIATKEYIAKQQAKLENERSQQQVKYKQKRNDYELSY